MIDWFIKMVYYDPMKIIINVSDLIKIILNIIIEYYSLFDSIVSDQGLVFILKFWLSLYYFLERKQKLFITFYLQIDS